ncbi:hypothetical protein RDI58_026658 [Solanum bulbocastanum]|uniref:Uncharacterized protein n=1 Tax=Solanum bulbocastanum TaxID=147425 RepID=A0AAN8SWT1_SOLBU
MYILMILSHFTFLNHIQEQQINNNEIPGIEDVAISNESGTDETLVEPIDDDRAIATPVAEISGEAKVHNIGRQSLQSGSVEARRSDINIKEPLWHQDSRLCQH